METDSISQQVDSSYRHREKMGAVTRLACGLSTDVGSLVDAAAASVRDALVIDGPDSKAHQTLEEASASLQRAAMIARQLGAISRQKPERPMLWSLGEKVNELMPLVNRLAGDRITVNTGDLSVNCWIKADSGHVEQVLFHLVVNARDAMPLGGDLNLTVDCQKLVAPIEHRYGVVPAGRWNVLEVSDTGTGMSESVMARLFEPFFTTKGAGLGSGLGLATVYGIANQLGGHVMVVSSAGKGSRVSVWVPQADPDSAEKADDDDLPTSAMIDSGQAVMVIDEDPWGRSVTSRALRREGLGVLEVGGVDDAIDVLADVAGKCVKVVVADLRLAGIRLADVLTRHSPGLGLVLTASKIQSAQRNQLPSNCKLLEKPYSQAQLLRAIGTVTKR